MGGNAINKILIVGGVHGVEPQSAYVAEELAKALSLKEIISAELEGIFKVYQGEKNGKSYIVVPDMNRHGLKNNTRGNVHGVDLNRNFPAYNWSSSYSSLAYFPGTHPSSETETTMLMKIIEKNSFDLIISIHTNHFIDHVTPPQVNFDGPQDTLGHKEAERLSEILELPFTHDIGYATPGSLGSLAKNKEIPCITLEMDDKFTSQGAWAKYGHEILRFLGAEVPTTD